MTTPSRQIDPGAAPTDFGRLRGLLDEQESLFVRLDALSKRQSGLVRDEATDELLGVLGDRQAVVEALDRVSSALDPFRARWDDVLAEARPEVRERLASKVDELAELAGRIAARDEADRRLIEERRDRLAGELAGMTNVRGAVAAYGSGGGRPPAKFQDREV